MAKLSGKETIRKQWMPKEDKETWKRHYHNPVATRWEVQKFWASPRPDGRILPIPGLPHDDRHLTPHSGIRSTGTRAPSRWDATMRIVKLDQWKEQEISNTLRKFSQVFNKNKEDRIPIPKNERTKQDHSMMHCEQNWSGRVKIGGPISRYTLPIHYLHKIGRNTNNKTLSGANTKTLNGANTKTPNGEITNGEIINERSPMERS